MNEVNNKERKLVNRYESISSGSTLQDITKVMQNKIDARLVVEEWSMTVEYKSYETDSEYTARLRRESAFEELVHSEDFQSFLKLYEKFKHYV